MGQTRRVLVDSPGVARTVHEAPEIDGVVHVPIDLRVGSLLDVVVTSSLGTDLVGEPLEGTAGAAVAARAEVAG